MSNKVKNKYVSNEDFWAALKRFNDSGLTLKEHPDGNYIGECIVKICTNLSYSTNFIGYTYRDEFVEDAIENCIRYVRSFDPNRSKHAFTYFSKVAYYAFLRRLKDEKKQQMIKFKAMSDSVALQEFIEGHDTNNSDLDLQGIVDQVQQFLKQNEKLIETTKNQEKAEPTQKLAENNLGKFFK